MHIYFRNASDKIKGKDVKTCHLVIALLKEHFSMIPQFLFLKNRLMSKSHIANSSFLLWELWLLNLSLQFENRLKFCMIKCALNVRNNCWDEMGKTKKEFNKDLACYINPETLKSFSASFLNHLTKKKKKKGFSWRFLSPFTSSM